MCKVIHAMVHCRTQTLRVSLYQCEHCGKSRLTFRSCGNRHCPTCQHHKTQQRVHKQMNRQVQGHHFLVTFTTPQQLHPFIRSNKPTSHSPMFTASSQAMTTPAADRKYLGGDLPGFFGILHTWGRQLHYRPHIRYSVPGGAVSTDDQTRHPSRPDLFLPVKALSILFRAKLRDEIKTEGLLDSIPWVVNSQAVGDSSHSIQSLAPYVFRVAISNTRILKDENDTVFFRYKKPQSNRWRTMALDAFEFIRRFLQHVLPKGFMKIR